MLAAFAEAIRATTQPCTLLLLLPSLVMAVVTRGRWAPFVAICIGAVLGGWLFVANVVALSDGPLQISGVLVGALIILAIMSPSMPWPRWAEHRSIETATAGVVGFVATLWWRPCIGSELGSILTSARDGITGQLPGISAYMLGTTMPVLAAVLVVRAIDPAPETARRVTWVAGGIGVVVAGAHPIGRHDELVTTLTRWTTTRPAHGRWNTRSPEPVERPVCDLTDAITRRGFAALNAVVRPAVQSGIGNPLLIGAGAVVLETTGRISGLARLVPVLSTRTGNTLTVSTVRSSSQWIRNAEADSNVAVWLGGQRREATATVRRGVLSTVRLDLVDRAS